MKPVIYLRIASILTLIHSILHTVGGVFGKPPSGQAAMVAASMRYRFEVFGVMRSYADFYRGLGLGVTIALTMDAAILWLLASLSKADAKRLRPIMVVILIGYLALALNSYTFFFYGPVVAELLIVGCIAAAVYFASPTQHDAARTDQLNCTSVQS